MSVANEYADDESDGQDNDDDDACMSVTDPCQHAGRGVRNERIEGDESTHPLWPRH